MHISIYERKYERMWVRKYVNTLVFLYHVTKIRIIIHSTKQIHINFIFIYLFIYLSK